MSQDEGSLYKIVLIFKEFAGKVKKILCAAVIQTWQKEFDNETLNYYTLVGLKLYFSY